MEIQLLLWNMIDRRKEIGAKLDYLQIFEFSIEDGKLKIIHKQEQPSFETIYYLSIEELPANVKKIWVIDSGEYSTMLFPDEY